MHIPFKLEPTYKDYIWGGNRLRSSAEITAEAWVVYEKNTISSGPYQGKTLAEAAEIGGVDLLGPNAIAQTGGRFPLLIKLLDCARWLSLQVHPNDEQARTLEGPGFFGKTEAWYVVEADEGAQLLSGFKSDVTQKQITDAVGKADILDLVVRRDVKSGDYLFMAPGTIHALGPGLLIYEIQQTSDITYRVYDWERPKTGRRKLHLEQAIEVLDPKAKGEVKSQHPEMDGNHRENLINCKYFSLDLITGQAGVIPVNTASKSFVALTILEGSTAVRDDGWSFQLEPFETILVPAACGSFFVEFSNPIRALLAQVP